MQDNLKRIDDVLEQSIADLSAICTYCPDFLRDCAACGIEDTRMFLVREATRQINRKEVDVDVA